MGDPCSVLCLTGLTSVNVQSLTHIGCDTSLCIGFHNGGCRYMLRCWYMLRAYSCRCGVRGGVPCVGGVCVCVRGYG